MKWHAFPVRNWTITLLFVCQVNVSQVQFASGKMIPASKFGKDDVSTQELTLTPEEEAMGDTLKVRQITCTVEITEICRHIYGNVHPSSSWEY